MTDNPKPSTREALRASAPVPPGSPLIVPWVVVAGAALLVLVLSGGYFLFFSFRDPPENKALRYIYDAKRWASSVLPVPSESYALRADAERYWGESSVHDWYFRLMGKAERYDQPELLAYLEKLEPLSLKERSKSGSVVVRVPGDLDMSSINWTDATHAQTALLADGATRVELPPAALAELKKRGDRIIELGASPNPPQHEKAHGPYGKSGQQ